MCEDAVPGVSGGVFPVAAEDVDDCADYEIENCVWNEYLQSDYHESAADDECDD